MHGKVNNKIDVYAFGVVLLELISGRKPLCTGCPKGQESLVMWVSSIHLYHLPLCANFTFGLCTRNGSFLWLKQIINCCLFSPGKFHHTRRKARTTCRSQLTYWRPLWWSWEDDCCCFPLHQTSTSEPSSNWCCKFFFLLMHDLRAHVVYHFSYKHLDVHIRFWSFSKATLIYSSGHDHKSDCHTRLMPMNVWWHHQHKGVMPTSSPTSTSHSMWMMTLPLSPAPTSSQPTPPWKSIWREDGAGPRASTDRSMAELPLVSL